MAYNIVELMDEEGVNIAFYHIATINYKRDDYAFFIPVYVIDTEEFNEFLVCRIERSRKGEINYVTISDEALLDKLFDEYVKLARKANGN